VPQRKGALAKKNSVTLALKSSDVWVTDDICTRGRIQIPSLLCHWWPPHFKRVAVAAAAVNSSRDSASERGEDESDRAGTLRCTCIHSQIKPTARKGLHICKKAHI